MKTGRRLLAMMLTIVMVAGTVGVSSFDSYAAPIDDLSIDYDPVDPDLTSDYDDADEGLFMYEENDLTDADDTEPLADPDDEGLIIDDLEPDENLTPVGAPADGDSIITWSVSGTNAPDVSNFIIGETECTLDNTRDPACYYAAVTYSGQTTTDLSFDIGVGGTVTSIKVNTETVALDQVDVIYDGEQAEADRDGYDTYSFTTAVPVPDSEAGTYNYNYNVAITWAVSAPFDVWCNSTDGGNRMIFRSSPETLEPDIRAWWFEDKTYPQHDGDARFYANLTENTVINASVFDVNGLDYRTCWDATTINIGTHQDTKDGPQIPNTMTITGDGSYVTTPVSIYGIDEGHKLILDNVKIRFSKSGDDTSVNVANLLEKPKANPQEGTIPSELWLYDGAHMSVGNMQLDSLYVEYGSSLNGLYDGDDLIGEEDYGDWSVRQLILNHEASAEFPYDEALDEYEFETISVGTNSFLHSEQSITVTKLFDMSSNSNFEMYHRNETDETEEGSELYEAVDCPDLVLDCTQANISQNANITIGRGATAHFDCLAPSGYVTDTEDIQTHISGWNGTRIFIDSFTSNWDSDGNLTRFFNFHRLSDYGQFVDDLDENGQPILDEDENTRQHLEYPTMPFNAGDTIAYLKLKEDDNWLDLCFPMFKANSESGDQTVKRKAIAEDDEDYEQSKFGEDYYPCRIYVDGIYLYKITESGEELIAPFDSLKEALAEIKTLNHDEDEYVIRLGGSTNISEFTVSNAKSVKLRPTADISGLVRIGITPTSPEDPGDEWPNEVTLTTDLILDNIELTSESIFVDQEQPPLDNPMNIGLGDNTLTLINSEIHAGAKENEIHIEGADSSTLVIIRDKDSAVPEDEWLWSGNGSIRVGTLKDTGYPISFSELRADELTVDGAELNCPILTGWDILNDPAVPFDWSTADVSVSGDSRLDLATANLGSLYIGEDNSAAHAVINLNDVYDENDPAATPTFAQVKYSIFEIAEDSSAIVYLNGQDPEFSGYSIPMEPENVIIRGSLSLRGHGLFGNDGSDMITTITGTGSFEARDDVGVELAGLVVRPDAEFKAMGHELVVGDLLELYGNSLFFIATRTNLGDVNIHTKDDENDNASLPYPVIKSAENSDLTINGELDYVDDSTDKLCLARVEFNRFTCTIGDKISGYTHRDRILSYRPEKYETFDAAEDHLSDWFASAFVVMLDEDKTQPVVFDIDNYEDETETTCYGFVLNLAGIDVRISAVGSDMDTHIGSFDTWADAVAFINGHGEANKKYTLGIRTDVDLDNAAFTIPTAGAEIEINGDSNGGAIPVLSFAGDIKLTNNLKLRCVELHSYGVVNSDGTVKDSATLNLNGKNLELDNATITSGEYGTNTKSDNGWTGFDASPVKAVTGNGNLTLTADRDTYNRHNPGTPVTDDDVRGLSRLDVDGAVTVKSLALRQCELSAASMTVAGDVRMISANASISANSKINGNAYMENSDIYMLGTTPKKSGDPKVLATLTVAKNAYMRQSYIAPEWYMETSGITLEPGEYNYDRMFSAIYMQSEPTGVTVNGDVYMLDSGLVATRSISVKNMYTSESGNTVIYGSTASDTFKVTGTAGEVYIPYDRSPSLDEMPENWSIYPDGPIEFTGSDVADVISVANNETYKLKNCAISVRRIDIESMAYGNDPSQAINNSFPEYLCGTEDNHYEPLADDYSSKAELISDSYAGERDRIRNESKNKKDLEIVVTKALPSFFAIGRRWCQTGGDPDHACIAFYTLTQNAKGTALTLDDTASYPVSLYKYGTVMRYEGETRFLEWDDAIVGSYQTVEEALKTITTLNDKNGAYTVYISAKASNGGKEGKGTSRTEISSLTKELAIPSAASNIVFRSEWDWTDQELTTYYGLPINPNPSANLNTKSTLDLKTNVELDGVKLTTAFDKNGNPVDVTFKLNGFGLTLNNSDLRSATIAGGSTGMPSYRNVSIKSVTGSGTAKGSSFTVKNSVSECYTAEVEVDDENNPGQKKKITEIKEPEYGRCVDAVYGFEASDGTWVPGLTESMPLLNVTGDINNVQDLALANVALYVKGKTNVGNVLATTATYTDWSDWEDGYAKVYTVLGASKLVTASTVKIGTIKRGSGDSYISGGDITVTPLLTVAGSITRDEGQQLTLDSWIAKTTDAWVSIDSYLTEITANTKDGNNLTTYDHLLKEKGLPIAKVGSIDTTNTAYYSNSKANKYDPVNYDPVNKEYLSNKGSLLKKGGMVCYTTMGALPYTLSYDVGISHVDSDFLTWADLVSEIDLLNNKEGVYTATLHETVSTEEEYYSDWEITDGPAAYGINDSGQATALTMPKSGKAASLTITTGKYDADEGKYKDYDPVTEEYITRDDKEYIPVWVYTGDKLTLTCDTTFENVRLLGYDTKTEDFITGNVAMNKNTDPKKIQYQYSPLAISTGGHDLHVSGYTIFEGRNITVDGGNKGSLIMDDENSHIFASAGLEYDYMVEDEENEDEYDPVNLGAYDLSGIFGNITKMATVILNGSPLDMGYYYKSAADILNEKRTPSQLSVTTLNLGEGEQISGPSSVTVTTLSLTGYYPGLSEYDDVRNGVGIYLDAYAFPATFKVTNLNMFGPYAVVAPADDVELDYDAEKDKYFWDETLSADVTNLTIADGALIYAGSINVTNLTNPEQSVDVCDDPETAEEEEEIIYSNMYSELRTFSGALNVKTKAEVHSNNLLFRAPFNTQAKVPASLINVGAAVTADDGCTIKVAVYENAFEDIVAARENQTENISDITGDPDWNRTDILKSDDNLDGNGKPIKTNVQLLTASKADVNVFEAWSDVDRAGETGQFEGTIPNPHLAYDPQEPALVIGPDGYDLAWPYGIMLFKSGSSIYGYLGSEVGAAVSRLTPPDADDYLGEFEPIHQNDFRKLGSDAHVGYYPTYTDAVAAVNKLNDKSAGYVIALLKDAGDADNNKGIDASTPSKAAFVEVMSLHQDDAPKFSFLVNKNATFATDTYILDVQYAADKPVNTYQMNVSGPEFTLAGCDMSAFGKGISGAKASVTMTDMGNNSLTPDDDRDVSIVSGPLAVKDLTLTGNAFIWAKDKMTVSNDLTLGSWSSDRVCLASSKEAVFNNIFVKTDRIPELYAGRLNKGTNTEKSTLTINGKVTRTKETEGSEDPAQLSIKVINQFVYDPDHGIYGDDQIRLSRDDYAQNPANGTAPSATRMLFSAPNVEADDINVVMDAGYNLCSEYDCTDPEDVIWYGLEYKYNGGFYVLYGCEDDGDNNYSLSDSATATLTNMVQLTQESLTYEEYDENLDEMVEKTLPGFSTYYLDMNQAVARINAIGDVSRSYTISAGNLTTTINEKTYGIMTDTVVTDKNQYSKMPMPSSNKAAGLTVTSLQDEKPVIIQYVDDIAAFGDLTFKWVAFDNRKGKPGNISVSRNSSDKTGNPELTFYLCFGGTEPIVNKQVPGPGPGGTPAVSIADGSQFSFGKISGTKGATNMTVTGSKLCASSIDGLNKVTLGKDEDDANTYTLLSISTVATAKATISRLAYQNGQNRFMASGQTTIGDVDISKAAEVVSNACYLYSTYNEKSGTPTNSNLTVTGEITGADANYDNKLIVWSISAGDFAGADIMDVSEIFADKKAGLDGDDWYKSCIDIPLMTAKKADPSAVCGAPFEMVYPDGYTDLVNYKDLTGTIIITEGPFPIRIVRNSKYEEGTLLYDSVDTYAKTWADAMAIIDNMATKADYDVMLHGVDGEVTSYPISKNDAKGTIGAPVFAKPANAETIHVLNDPGDDYQGENYNGEVCLQYTGALNPSVNIDFGNIKLVEGKYVTIVSSNGGGRFTVFSPVSNPAFKLTNDVTVSFGRTYNQIRQNGTMEPFNVLDFSGGFSSSKGHVCLINQEVVTAGVVTLNDVIVDGNSSIVSRYWSSGANMMTTAEMLGKVTIASIHGTGENNEQNKLTIDSVYTATEPAKSVSQVSVTKDAWGTDIVLRPVLVSGYYNKTAFYQPLTEQKFWNNIVYRDMSKAPDARMKLMDGTQVPSDMVHVEFYRDNKWTVPEGMFAPVKYKGGIYVTDRDPRNMPITVVAEDQYDQIDDYGWVYNEDLEEDEWVYLDSSHSYRETSYYSDWDTAVADVSKMAASNNDLVYTMQIGEDIGATFVEDKYPVLATVTMKKMTFPTKVDSLNIRSVRGDYGFFFTDPSISIPTNAEIENVSFNCVKAVTNKNKTVTYIPQNYNISAGANDYVTFADFHGSQIGSYINNYSGGTLTVGGYLEAYGNVTVNTLYIRSDSTFEVLGPTSTVKAKTIDLYEPATKDDAPLEKYDENSWGGTLRAANVTATEYVELHGWSTIDASASDKIGTGVVTIKDVYTGKGINMIIGKQNNKHASLITITGDVYRECFDPVYVADPDNPDEYIPDPDYEDGWEYPDAEDGEKGEWIEYGTWIRNGTWEEPVANPLLIGLKYCNSTEVYAQLFGGESILTSKEVSPDDIWVLANQDHSTEGHVIPWGVIGYQTDEDGNLILDEENKPIPLPGYPGFLYHLERPDKSKTINIVIDENCPEPDPNEPGPDGPDHPDDPDGPDPYNPDPSDP